MMGSADEKRLDVSGFTFRDYVEFYEAKAQATQANTTGAQPTAATSSSGVPQPNTSSTQQTQSQANQNTQTNQNAQVPRPSGLSGKKPPFDLNSLRVGGYVGYRPGGPGSKVDNYKVKQIHPDGVVIDVNGKNIRVPNQHLTKPTATDKTTGYGMDKAANRKSGDADKKGKDLVNTLLYPAKQFMSGYRTGMGINSSVDYDDELTRLMELAGLREIGSMGGTGAASVASASKPMMPSVVGNTNDAHKPSVKIRAKLKKEKDKVEYAKEKAKERAKKEGGY